MMQNLRRQTRLILFIVVAAFALLIFFQWGLDITGIAQNKDTDIAKIENTTISYTDYLRYVQAKERENKNLSREEIWQDLVDEVVWNTLIQKERISVSDEEIWEIIKGNPPRQVYESEYMKNEKGEFDYNKYLELLKAPQSRQWLFEYEMNLRRELPKEKLRSLISTMGWSSPFEDSVIMAKQTTTYDVSFISIFPFRLRGLLSISDDELKEFYNKNRKDFITPESKIFKYVYFEKKPSPQDTIEAKEILEDFLLRIKEGEDFLKVAREVSDDTIIEVKFADENELFTWRVNVYKELKDGQVSDVFPTPEGFEVIKRIKKGHLYVVKSRIKVSPSTIGEIQEKIESFKETAKGIGFDSTASEFNLMVRKTPPLNPERLNFPVRNPEALAKILSKKMKKDEIAGPLSSIGGYYLLSLDSIIPKKVFDLKENKQIIQSRYERVKLKEIMSEYLENVYNRIISGNTLEQVADSDTLLFKNEIKDANLFEIESRYGPEFAGQVFQLEVGQTSRPLITEWSGYIIRCDKKISAPFDSTMVQQLQILRQRRLQYLSQSIFKPKKLVDNRDRFFE
uniref:Periplasmic chaperone PpiD n=1 Tax=candidate division WOR-3 bacterium TaxID=2052148 RepID=A0A7C4TGK9_UNCW3